MRRISVVVLTIIFILPITGLSQTRRRTTPRPARPSLEEQRAAEVKRTGATRVSDQIKVLTKFIYLLGGVAKTLEGVNEAASRNQQQQTAAQQTERTRTVIRNSIRDVRAGLDKLEIDFRATPELQRYYTKLAGVAAGAATAEELAAANQFDRAGRALLDVVNRLADVLVEM